jgi:hypothetical protein
MNWLFDTFGYHIISNQDYTKLQSDLIGAYMLLMLAVIFIILLLANMFCLYWRINSLEAQISRHADRRSPIPHPRRVSR